MHQDIPDENLFLKDFHTVQTNRDSTVSSKLKGGGFAILVNNRECNLAHITIKEWICFRLPFFVVK